MKKLIFILAIAALPLTSFGQSIFDKYENSDDVTFVVMQPKMFQMLGSLGIDSNDPEAKEYLALVNSVKSFKVITTDKPAVTKDISAWVSKHVKSSSLQELMRVRDGDTNVKFYVKEGKDANHVKELLMYVTGLKDQVDVDVNGKSLETVILSLTGDIDLRQIGKLTDQMDLPGGKQLKKAGEDKQ